MTIDERLNAITMHLELIARMQHDNEGRIAENDRRFAQVTRNFEIVHDSIKGLEAIAMAHEHRPDRIEGEQ